MDAKILGIAASLGQRLPIDGRDAWPAIAEGKPPPRDEILFNTTPKGGAIRIGDWKLVLAIPAQPKKKASGATVQLFNLRDDPGEREDLAAKFPEKVAALRTRYDALAKEAAPPKNTAE